MTSIPTDATPLHAAPHSPPRPVRHAENPAFAAHLSADHARAEDARANADVARDGAMGALAGSRHLPSPSGVALATPLHLWPTESGAERVFAWGLHVNGYLSEIGTGKAASTASPAVAERYISNVEGGLVAMNPRDVAADDAASDATNAPTALTLSIQPPTPFDAVAGPADAATSSGASSGVAGTSVEPFQRTLLRWFERPDGRTVYVRDFRLSTSQVQSLAARLHAWAQGHAGLARVIVNGHTVSISPSHQPQGAPACPWIP